MNKKNGKILPQEYEAKPGVNYLMPLSWWEQFCKGNSASDSIQNMFFPDLMTEQFVESFLYDFEGSIIEQLELKCNHVKLNRILMSPEINKNVSWVPISPSLWKTISKKRKNIRPILTITNSADLQSTIQQPFLQFQIVFSTNATAQAFVGFLPAHSQLVQAVRQIGYQMGFIEMEKTKIKFPDIKVSQTYSFHEYENIDLQEAPDTIIMAFNMEKMEENIHEQQFSFNNGEMVNSSKQVLAGDLGMIANESWSHLQNSRTLSTGAQTPYFSFSRDEMQQFRVRELFRDKKPQEIEQMKIEAELAINGELIQVREKVQEENLLEKELQKISEQILEQIQFHKKKSIKEKQIHE